MIVSPYIQHFGQYLWIHKWYQMIFRTDLPYTLRNKEAIYRAQFPPLCKGGGARISNRTCQWGIFFEILVGGQKGRDSMFCGSSVGGTIRGWSIFS